jgi:His-Xaa-Ser system protein HxsD
MNSLPMNASREGWVLGAPSVSVRVSRSIYAKTAILAATYQYAGRYGVLLKEDADQWVVEFRLREPSDAARDDVVERFLDDLVDFQLRHELEITFAPLREAIVAKAFGKMA